MGEEEIVAEKPKTRWFIAQDWFQQNNRSISPLLQNYLCPKCAKKLSSGKKENSPDVLMAAIRDCCSHTPDFINEHLPVMESVFRTLLANGNQPLNLEELGEQLRERRGGDTYHSSPEILSRLLVNDHYYGFGQVQD